MGRLPGSLVLLLGQLTLATAAARVAGSVLPLPGISFKVVNFNFEFVQVTWNTSYLPATNLTFLYKLGQAADYALCPRYLFRGTLQVGCCFEVRGDAKLYFLLLNGTQRVLRHGRYLGDYLKPAPPGALRFEWGDDRVRVTCPPARLPDLRFQLQHRRDPAEDWQTLEAPSCAVTFFGVPPSGCHWFRARVRAQAHTYSPDAQPSDWTPLSLQQDGRAVASCPLRRPYPESPRFLFTCGLLASGMVLLLLLLLLGVCKLTRVKRLLMPNVPDPSSPFHGLFEHHHGNFQDWIQDSGGVAPLGRAETGEADCLSEVALVVKDLQPSNPGPSGQGASDLGPSDPELVTLGGFSFMLTDGVYLGL